MKKIILFLLINSLFIIPVFARDNRLYLVESDGGLYYESKLIDEDVFMKHTDMVPGEKYTDILKIENAASDKYLLFFKVNDSDDQFLRNIIMRVYIDDTLIYNGIATGEDYVGDNISLKNIVCLGYVEPGVTHEMKVTTQLSKKYTDVTNDAISSIDWTFYAQYPATEEPEPLPQPAPIDPDDPDPEPHTDPDVPIIIPDDPHYDDPNPADTPGIVEILPIPNTGISSVFDSRFVSIYAEIALGMSILVVFAYRKKTEKQ